MFVRPELEMTLEEVQSRGAEAQRMLDSALFSYAATQAVYNIIEEWLIAPTVEEREQAWHKVQAAEGLQQALRAIVSDGEHAKRAIQVRERNDVRDRRGL